MLVLTRDVGQFVEITTPDGHTIRVTVVEIRGRCRIGFEAKREISLIRGELLEPWLPLSMSDIKNGDTIEYQSVGSGRWYPGIVEQHNGTTFVIGRDKRDQDWLANRHVRPRLKGSVKAEKHVESIDIGSPDSSAVQHNAVSEEDAPLSAFRAEGALRVRKKLGRS